MKIGKITVTALLLSVSFMLSLLEGVVPISALIPIPGLKLGLANVAVMAAVFIVGKPYAFALVALRPVLSLVLFGNVTSALMSLSGGIFAFFSVMLSVKLYGKFFSFCGISSISAFFHSLGQIVMASVILSGNEVFGYFPVLACASSVTGFLTGVIMNIVIPRTESFFGKRRSMI